MNTAQKTALGFLITSLIGTVAFFSLLATNTQRDRGNEWFSYEGAIMVITALAVIGTAVALVGWNRPHGKKMAVGGVCVLVAYYFIYFASWSSEGGSTVLYKNPFHAVQVGLCATGSVGG